MNNTYSRASAWKPALLALGLVGAALTGARAQALNYPAANATTSAGTYTDLAATGSAITTPNNDDANSAATDIGFTFTFGGTAFTQFVLNTNGFIRLGATAPTTPYFGANGVGATNGPLASTTNTNLILPFNTDLEAGTGGTEYRVYTRGTAPNRVCTIQWKNVSDKARAGATATIPKQYSNFSFQARLYETTNTVEFVYGTATPITATTTASFSAVGLKGNGTAANQAVVIIKASNTPWAQGTFTDGNYPAAGNAFNFRSFPTAGGTAESVLPDPGRTFRFDVPVPNDASVSAFYNIEKLPARQGFVYRALIRNSGTTALSAGTATLTVSGANTATQTGSIAALAVGASALVTFPNVVLTNAGTNTVTVTLPSDGNTSNNTRTANTLTQATNTTSSSTFSYVKTAPFTSGRGFGPLTPAEEYAAAFCAAYTTNSSFRLTTVRATIYPDQNAIGQSVYGVITDLSGNLLAQSARVTIDPADLGVVKEFTLQVPITVQAGTFLAGMAQVVNDVAYFPIATQDEAAGRSGTFYTVAGVDDPPGTVTDVSTAATPANYIFMVEAAGLGTTLATASPALTRAFTLYPNPSTDGLFTLAVRGANAPGGLRVEVTNQLGQRVYTGAARDNGTSTLDLGTLANGIYFMTLRNGEEFSTTKVSINR